jgi:1-acyl-sn-glycerol-3-phosphate acyltransferase
VTDPAVLHERARTRGVNPLVYWVVRAVLQPFFRVYFRLRRLGREHVPQSGPVLLAANHRSFLDPFIIGTMLRRPVYYVAKKELFERRLQAWFLNALGAFPVDRGSSDQEMLTTARAILERGDAVVIFPEGTRIRPGALGTPKRGVGRLALETGAPIVPIALVGTEDVRRGWRIRPRRITIRVGRPLTYPQVDRPSRSLAQAVTDRIWPCVQLQWEWLGGTPPIRTAAIVGHAPALAAGLREAGIDPTGAVGEADVTIFAGPGGVPRFARRGRTIATVAGDGRVASEDRAFAKTLERALRTAARAATPAAPAAPTAPPAAAAAEPIAA